MPIVRITASNRTDRLQMLEDGMYEFGSNFDADLVLIDDGVLPLHFILKVTANDVRVLLADGAVGRLVHRKGEVEPLTPGQEYTWKAGQHLETAGLKIEIGGANHLAPTTGQSEQRKQKIRSRRRLGLSSMITALVLITAGNGSVGTGAIFASTAVVLEPEQTAEAIASAQVQRLVSSLTAPDVEDILIEAGFAPDRVVPAGEGFEAVLYHPGAKDREMLAAFLADRHLPIRTRDYLQTQILSAVNIILESSMSDVRLERIDGGDVTLKGLRGNVEAREAMAATIQADVVGVKSVTFVDHVQSDAEDVTKGITAVWTGERPYVVLSDGAFVRPGQLLRDDIELEQVIAVDRILVRMNGTVEEIFIQ